MPEGYRGVKNLLIKLTDEDQSAIDELNDTLTTAKNTLNDVNGQLEDLRAEDTSAYDAETLASYNEQIAALEEQATAAQATIDETTAAVEEKTETAFAAILPKAQEVLDTEFPDIASGIELHIPDESSRRVGQSVAAASLPEIRKA